MIVVFPELTGERKIKMARIVSDGITSIKFTITTCEFLFLYIKIYVGFLFLQIDKSTIDYFRSWSSYLNGSGFPGGCRVALPN